MWLLKN